MNREATLLEWERMKRSEASRKAWAVVALLVIVSMILAMGSYGF